ncbi:MAG: hypothetical protein WA918_02335, partial [Erythrobacter sp.]
MFTQSPFALVCLTVLLAGSSPIFAQERGSEDKAPDTVEIRTEAVNEIEVIGERPLTEDEISHDIYELVQSNKFGAPIPRFHDPLCLHVSGLG